MLLRLVFVSSALAFVASQSTTRPTTPTGVNLDDLIDTLFPNPNPSPGTKPTRTTATPINSRPTGTKTTTARPTPTPTFTPINPTNFETCDGGECVPFYLCDSDNSIIADGAGVIDIRFGGVNASSTEELQAAPKYECKDYLTVCCGAEHVVNDSLITPTVHEGCGYRNINGIGFKLFNSAKHDSEYGEFPWMMAVVREEVQLGKKLSVYLAGGSLIHPKVVMTAAHYVHNKVPHELIVRAGEWDTQTNNELFPHEDRPVDTILVHEKFNKANLHNDMALLILQKPLDLVENIRTVCLPPPQTNFDSKNCVASGWGKDLYGREGKYQVILKRVELPIVRSDVCQNTLRTTRLGKRFVLDKSFICAGGVPGKDTCYGDGGSPLVCPIGNGDITDRYYQAGIVAWGLGCGDTIPGAYTNVAMFRNWIDAHMKRLNLDTSYYTPK